MAHRAYVPPTRELKAFNCAYCGVYATQDWYHMECTKQTDGFGRHRWDDRFRVSYCGSCGFPTIWLADQLIWPDHSADESPNPDLPDHIRSVYDEARSIASKSPRGSAALLRLAIQMLCKHLGLPGQNINDDIRALVSKGLPEQIQMALDIVRVVGNDCVHPGQIDYSDDRETVSKLFGLVNFISHKMITEPNEIAKLYNKLPDSKRDAIKRRDSE